VGAGCAETGGVTEVVTDAYHAGDGCAGPP
jgi:hypothetical protein